MIISFGLKLHWLRHRLLDHSRCATLSRTRARGDPCRLFALDTFCIRRALSSLAALAFGSRFYSRRDARRDKSFCPSPLRSSSSSLSFATSAQNQVDLRDAPPKDRYVDHWIDSHCANFLRAPLHSPARFCFHAGERSPPLPSENAFALYFRERVEVVLFIGITVLELFTANIRTNAVPLFDPYPHIPLIDPIRNDETPFFRVQDDARMQGHYGCGYGLNEWASISPIRLSRGKTFDHRAPKHCVGKCWASNIASPRRAARSPARTNCPLP